MGDYWVCQYGNTRGNTNGYFEENVLVPVRSVSECGGTSSDVPDVVQQATTTTTTTTTTTVATTTTTAAQLECSVQGTREHWCDQQGNWWQQAQAFFFRVIL